MKKSRFIDAQIMNMLKDAQQGRPVTDICREHALSNAQFYCWRSKYGGIDASMISELKALQEENRRLKKMYADVQLQKEILQEAMRKKVVKPS
jgi:putative transposase